MNDENKKQIYFFEYKLDGDELREFQSELLKIQDKIMDQILEETGYVEANAVIAQIKAKL